MFFLISSGFSVCFRKNFRITEFLTEFANQVLDGSIPADRKDQILDEFKNDSSIKVLALSIRVGGVGLNLTTANIVVLMEPWWNPAVENQAIDRINRIGQKKSMRVHQFIACDTIEEKIRIIREEKVKLFAMTVETYKEQSSSVKDLGLENELPKEKIKFLLEK